MQSALTQSPIVKWGISSLSNKTKRLVYLSSLMASVNDTQVLDLEVMNKLNKILKLVSVKLDAMSLPVHLSGVIWKYKHLCTAEFQSFRECSLNGTCATVQIRKLVETTPQWFRYASFDEIVQDLETLFSSEHKLVV